MSITEELSPYNTSVLDWNVDKVSKWVSYLGLGSYSSLFYENNIAGDVLIHLTQTELEEIGVKSVGHQLRILKAIYEIIIRQDIPVEGDHYIPPTVMEAKGDIPISLVQSLEIRDERMGYAENEIRKLNEGVHRLREDLLPIFRMAKESKPLPTPEAPQQVSPGNNNVTFNNAANIHQSTSSPTLIGPSVSSPPSQMTSPTYNQHQQQQQSSSSSQAQQGHGPVPSPGVKRVISKKSMGALSTNSSARSPTQQEYFDDNSRYSRSQQQQQQQQQHQQHQKPQGLSSSSGSTSAGGGGSSSSSSPGSSEPFKSFRVTMDDPCYKVLPAALRKYKISGDWRQYALMVCYGDQERVLGLEEKPLIIFKELQDAGKRPVFMLRQLDNSSNASSNKNSRVVVGGTTPGGVL